MDTVISFAITSPRQINVDQFFDHQMLYIKGRVDQYRRICASSGSTGWKLAKQLFARRKKHPKMHRANIFWPPDVLKHKRTTNRSISTICAISCSNGFWLVQELFARCKKRTKMHRADSFCLTTWWFTRAGQTSPLVSEVDLYNVFAQSSKRFAGHGSQTRASCTQSVDYVSVAVITRS